MKRGGLEIQRLSCSRGFTQAKQNIDYDEVFALVTCMETIQLIIVLTT